MAEYPTYPTAQKMPIDPVSEMSVEGGLNTFRDGPSKANIASALDEVTYQIERYSELLEKIHHRLSPILNNYSVDGETPEKKRGDDGSSDLQNELRFRAFRLKDLNDGLATISERIDL